MKYNATFVPFEQMENSEIIIMEHNKTFIEYDIEWTKSRLKWLYDQLEKVNNSIELTKIANERKSNAVQAIDMTSWIEALLKNVKTEY
jgi:hypothetical protein